MIMLTRDESNGARALIQLMMETDVISLAMTITCGQITIESVEEAARAIVAHSKSAVELVKRRKLKRELLFQYLFNNNIPVDPKLGKVQLAKRVLEHWGTNNVDILDLMEIGDDLSPGASLIVTPGLSPIQNTPGVGVHPLPNLVQDIPANQLNCGATGPATSTVYAAGESWIADFMDFENAVQSNPEDQAMGSEFARWFYQMVNSSNPHGHSCDAVFGTQHFFPDCLLKVAIINSNQLESHAGAEAVCQKFMQLTQQEMIIFNANVDVGGIMAFATPHGLKIFLVCGTIHKGGNMVGIFAQQFGLVRNPEQNFNWNIKFTNLKLIAGEPSQQPTLDNPGNVLPLQK